MKPSKPRYGDPCNGCGQCCLAEQCPLSLNLFGDCGICPALIDAGDQWRCGLISKPEIYFPHIPQDMGKLSAAMLGTWSGRCDASSTPEDRAIAEEMSALITAETDAERPAIEKMMDDVLAKLRVIRQLEEGARSHEA